MTNTKRINFYFSRLAVFLLAVGLLTVTSSSSVEAQPVLGAQNTAMGGGGTTYLTGFEATFWNPANLAINDRHGQFHIGIGHAGVIYEPVLSADNPYDQFFNFTDSILPHKHYATAITPDQREYILDRNYPQDNLLARHQSRGDVILGGISWQRGNTAYAIAARSRFASRIEVGRGWYSDDFITSEDRQVRDLTLNQQRNLLFELSFGYGQQFTFIDGLFPRLSELYVGIAPKAVLAGPSFDATYDARYIRSEGSVNSTYATDFSYRTTGEYSQMTSHYLGNTDPWSAIDDNLSNQLNLENTTGYGLGFDFGLTYLIPLDLSILEEDPDKSVISQSIRFSLSASDVGMIRYYENPQEISSAADTVFAAQEPPKESMFIGSAGQYLTYFDDAEAISNPLLEAQEPSSENFYSLLPTSLNAGMLIDLSRLKVSGDINLGLKETAFTTKKLAIHLGVEGRPLRPIPLRLGARLASESPTYIGLGTGIETRYWDFNIGSQLMLRSRTFTSELTGGAFAGFQLHL